MHKKTSMAPTPLSLKTRGGGGARGCCIQGPGPAAPSPQVPLSSTFQCVPHLLLKSSRRCSFPPNIQSWLGLGLGVRVGLGLGVGAGIRVRVGFKDSVGVQSGQIFPSSTFDAHGASRAFGAHGCLGAAPLATNCWPEAPRGGGVVGILGPAESPPPLGRYLRTLHEILFNLSSRHCIARCCGRSYPCASLCSNQLCLRRRTLDTVAHVSKRSNTHP